MFAVLCDGSNFAVFAGISLRGFVVKVRFKLNRLHGLHSFHLSTKLVLASFDRFQFTMHCVDKLRRLTDLIVLEILQRNNITFSSFLNVFPSKGILHR